MIKKRRLILILAIALAVALGIAFLMNKDKGSIFSAREATVMTEYLEKKYGQEFVVENVRVEGSGLGVKGAWVGDAHPKSDPSVRFKIEISQTTNKISVDTFLETLWSKEGAGEVEEFLAKELPNNEGYVLRIEPGRKLYDSIQGSIPSIESVLKDHKDQVVYSLSVRNAVTLTSGEPSGIQLENALKVVNFVKSKDISPASFAYYIYRDSTFSDHDGAGKQKYQYGFHVERDELNRVNTTTDLRQYFKTLGR